MKFKSTTHAFLQAKDPNWFSPSEGDCPHNFNPKATFDGLPYRVSLTTRHLPSLLTCTVKLKLGSRILSR